MRAATRKLWELQERHPGDRHRLFAAVAAALDAADVLYPGSFVDIAPSFVFDSVTYVDVDRRAATFFSDPEGVADIVRTHRGNDTFRYRFIHGDYTDDVGLAPDRFDLLISLYAGFVSPACTGYLRRGGWLLVNPSHGDAAMASIDPRYRLSAVVQSRAGKYRVTNDALDTYLEPKRAEPITPASLRTSGTGIAYTKSAFAYVFEHVGG